MDPSRSERHNASVDRFSVPRKCRSARFAQGAVLTALAGLVALGAVACGGTDSNATDGCAEGATQSCRCDQGGSSTRTCEPDGTWSPCACDTEMESGSDSGDANSGSDSESSNDDEGSADWTHPSDIDRTLVGKQIDGEVAIDGTLDDAYGPAHRVTVEPPTDDSDNRTSVRALWNDQRLFLAVSVEDEELVAPDEGDLWERDSVQVYLDPDRARNPGELLADDYSVLVDAEGRSLVRRGGSGGQSEAEVDLEAATKQTADGYRVEVALDWGDLGGEPDLGKRMGLLIANHDRTGDQRASYAWGLGPEQGFNDPSKWGDLRLGPRSASDDPGLGDGDDDDTSDTKTDPEDWRTPYPDPPEDATHVSPGEASDAIDGLQPGDTLVLEDGTYSQFDIDGLEGTESAPITIMAKNERRPVVRGDGYHAALRIDDSSHIRVQGIRFENVEQDASDTSDLFGAMAIYITSSDHITLWRNIARKPNVYGNNTAIKLASGTSDSLVEENEVLDFHRNGIAVHNGSGETGSRDNVLRRNYINPRDTRWKGRRWGPNYAIACYRAVDTIVENNIIHYSMESGEEARNIQNPGAGNEFYGNISIRAEHGFGHFYYDTDVRSLTMENNLVVSPKKYGLYAHSMRGFTARNNTIVDPGKSGFLVTDRDDKSPDFTSVNNLVVGAGAYGFEMSNSGQFSGVDVSYSGGWDNADGNFDAGFGNPTNTPPSTDPQFGKTYVHVPDDSAYAGAGRNGADVGANILYQYENGELTDKPLWHPRTGEFVHGAVIDGVNNLEGHSAVDVHEQLGVRPETLPDDY